MKPYSGRTRFHAYRRGDYTAAGGFQMVVGGGGRFVEESIYEGAYRPVNAIFKFDLRSGWMRFMDLVRPTDRGNEHEITTPI